MVQCYDSDAFPRSTPLNTEAAGAAPPDAFGPFRVLHQIGAGTLGPVFRAYDPDQDRLVAVKLFKLNLTPERIPQFIDRLQHLIDADLAHPAMAAPILAGVADASPFLAQDFVAADSLDTVIREFGGAPGDDAARVAAQLAGALDFAAAVGVLHGALHPRDVLLATDDARVTGFGIAQALDAIGVMPPVRRPYAAPERVAGDAWDRRADVYSLAVLIAEMMTGRRPSSPAAIDGLFDGDDNAALRAVFAQALAERPADRFPTALAFADALKQTVDRSLLAVSATPRQATAGRAVVPPTPLELPLAGPLSIDEPLRGAMPELLPGDVPLDTAVHADDTADLTLATEAGPGGADDATDWALRGVDREPVLAEQPSLMPRDDGETPPSASAAASESASVVTAPTSAAGLPPVAPVGAPPAPSSVWPIPVALLVGVIVGIALGFFVFANRGAEPAVATATATAPAIAQMAAAPPASPRPAAPVVSPEVAEPAAAADMAKAPAPPADARAAGTPAAVPPPPPAAVTRPPAGAPRNLDVPAPRPRVERRTDPSPARGATAGGRVLVRTSPAGARVVLNGRDVGTTPTTLRTLPFGTHTLRLTRAGYAAAERRVTVSASQPAQSVVVDLEPARQAAASAAAAGALFTAALTVESRPTGATVFLDGRRIGTTPLTVSSIETGSHVVRLELDGYRRWSSSVRVAADERNRVTASLEQ